MTEEALPKPASELASPELLNLEGKLEAIAEPVPTPQSAQSTEPAFQRELRSWIFALCGWLVPGLGHALQRMWGRAFVVFTAVGVLIFAGASMKGNVFVSQGADAFDKLGYLADMGSGVFYFIARALESSGADVSHAQGDYGTRFIATAGVLNLLAALHAYEAARGRKG